MRRKRIAGDLRESFRPHKRVRVTDTASDIAHSHADSDDEASALLPESNAKSIPVSVSEEATPARIPTVEVREPEKQTAHSLTGVHENEDEYGAELRVPQNYHDQWYKHLAKKNLPPTKPPPSETAQASVQPLTTGRIDLTMRVNRGVRQDFQCANPSCHFIKDDGVATRGQSYFYFANGQRVCAPCWKWTSRNPNRLRPKNLCDRSQRRAGA